MERNISIRILTIAYEAYKKVGSRLRSAFNIYEVSKGWGVTKEEIERGVEYLVGAGSIKYFTEDGEIYITQKGVEKCERIQYLRQEQDKKREKESKQKKIGFR
jgi:hypothetical protein